MLLMLMLMLTMSIVGGRRVSEGGGVGLIGLVVGMGGGASGKREDLTRWERTKMSGSHG